MGGLGLKIQDIVFWGDLPSVRELVDGDAGFSEWYLGL